MCTSSANYLSRATAVEFGQTNLSRKMGVTRREQSIRVGKRLEKGPKTQRGRTKKKKRKKQKKKKKKTK